MPRPRLRTEQVVEFRARLVAAALRLFAERGYGAVSLRGLGKSLGCSAAAPYRYFAGKRGIFSAVRAAGFDLLAKDQRSLLDDRSGAEEQLRRLARGYLEFARREPHAFRVMFELEGPHASATEEERSAETRAFDVLQGAARRAVAEGVLGGDPGTQAHVIWASLHGIASLHLSGKLLHGLPASALGESTMDALLAGSKPGRKAAVRPPRPKERRQSRRAPETGEPRGAEWKVW